MVGKWHLGWERDDMPIHHGFDFYYGIPAGEDETDFIYGDSARRRDSVELRPSSRGATRSEAVRFIADRGSRPAFMYVAHRDPHLDNHPAPRVRRAARAAGAYGDVVEQLDASRSADLMALAARR